MNLNKHKLTFSFIALGIFLIGQFVFTIKIIEPYPAIILPGFGKFPEYSENTLSFTDFELHAVFSDGKAQVLQKEKVFKEIIPWHIPSNTYNLLTSSRFSETGSPKEMRILGYTFSIQRTKLVGMPKNKEAEFKKWLLERVIEVSESNEVVGLNIVYIKRTVKKGVLINEKVIDTKTINLR